MSVFLKNLDLSKIKGRQRPAPVVKQQPMAFPVKLHRMLEAVEQNGLEHVVSWHPNGRSFHVHSPDKFVAEVLPYHFRQTKYKSFQRQLNFYGFQRVNSGPLEGSYGHPSFIRGEGELAKNIKRVSQLSEEQRQSVQKSVVIESRDTEMTSTNDEGSSQYEADLEYEPMEPDFVARSSPSGRRDSFQVFLDSSFGSFESKRRESFGDGKRLSFVGKKFFFLPVEFTDLYGM